jgi:anthranilate synthase component 1
VVGYFDFAGNADLAIAIRTAVIRDGQAHVQAGAGIVLDSVAETENQETLSKASAPLRAIQAANHMLRFGR